MTTPSDPVAKLDAVSVFVSSTFEDMREERIALANIAFSQLRAWCEERGITWSEIDLRWGVTEEEIADGDLLPICLEEIERCGPFFIGLIGDRYGTTLEEVPEDVLPPELAEQLPLSLTHIEIEHSLRASAREHSQALFYFRAGVRQSALPPKLKALWTRVQESGRPHDTFRTPEELAAHVLRDVRELLEACTRPAPVSGSAARDVLAQRAYGMSLSGPYARRDALHALLTEHVLEAERPLALVGEQGSGRSSLIVNWAVEFQREHPDHRVCVHHVGVGDRSTSPPDILERVLLAASGSLPDRSRLFAELPALLERAAAKTPIVIAIDGLERCEARGLGWLPPRLPRNVTLVVTLSGEEWQSRAEERDWRVEALPRLTEQEVELVIDSFTRVYRKNLADDRRRRLAEHPACRLPLFLSIVLDELRVDATHKTLEQRLARYLQCDGVGELLELVFDRLQRDHRGRDGDLAARAMGLLCGVRRGLSDAEMLDLLSDATGPLPGRFWIPLRLALRRVITTAGGLSYWTNPAARECATRRFFAQDRVAVVQEALYRYFQPQKLTVRKLDEYPDVLAGRERWAELRTWIGAPSVLKAMVSHDKQRTLQLWSRIAARLGDVCVETYRSLIDAPRQDLDAAWSAADLLADRGALEEEAVIRRALVEAFRESGDRRSLGSALGPCGRAEARLSGLLAARDCYSEQHAVYDSLNDDAGCITALGNIGMVLQDAGRIDDAMLAYADQFDRARAAGDPIEMSRALGNAAAIELRRGDLRTAGNYLDQEWRICRELGDSDRMQACLLSRADLAAEVGDFDKAEALYQQQIDLCRRFGNQIGVQAGLGNRAAMHIRAGRLDGVATALAEQGEICLATGYAEGKAAWIAARGALALAQHNLVRARNELVGSVAAYRSSSDTWGLQAVLGNLGFVLSELGERADAIHCYTEQAEILAFMGHASGHARALGALADVALLEGSTARAMEHLELAIPEAEKGKDCVLTATLLGNLAAIAGVELEDAERGRDLARRALELLDRAGESPHTADTVEALRTRMTSLIRALGQP